MDEQAVRNLVRAARMWAAEHAVPWLAPALFGVSTVFCEALPSIAAVDRRGRIYFRPSLVRQLVGDLRPECKLGEIAFLWYHEVAHLVREHAARAEELPAKASLWNMAADMEINDHRPEGLRYPNEFPPLLPKDYHLPAGRVAEYYYYQLLDRERARSAQITDAPACDSEGGGPESRPDRTSRGASEQQRSACVPKTPSAFADEGSGVHGEPRSWEVSGDQDSAGLNEFDLASIRQTVAEQILSKLCGSVPAGWERWANEQLRPKVNWRKHLQRMLRGTITEGIGKKLDYRYSRPHRRSSVYHPLYLPTLAGDIRPHIACVVDTSGSMSNHDLASVLAEVGGVLDQVHAMLTVIPCDAVPYEPIQVFTRSRLANARKSLRGGGGTNMTAGIEAALSLRFKPDVVLVLTDGYTPYPDHTYPVPVIFGILKPDASHDPPSPPTPPWRNQDIVFIPVERGDLR